MGGLGIGIQGNMKEENHFRTILRILGKSWIHILLQVVIIYNHGILLHIINIRDTTISTTTSIMKISWLVFTYTDDQIITSF